MIRTGWRRSVLPLVFLVACLADLRPCPSAAQQDGVIAIRAGRILTISGEEIADGVVVVRGGKIAAVGKNVAIPAGATVIEAAGKVVMPGIVDANAHFGTRGDDNEQAAEVTPQVRALRFFNPRSPEVKRALIAGVTTACLTPGTSNAVGGVCAVVKTAGESLKSAILKDAVGVRAALGSDVSSGNSGFRTFGGGEALTSIYARRPNSRMAAVWELRKALFDGKYVPGLAAVLKGELPLRINARIENDIRAALTIAEEFGLSRLVLDECTEGYRVADEIAARKVPVVLGPSLDPHGTSREGEEVCLNTAGILADRGVRIAFGSNGGDATELRSWAAFAVRGGLKPEIALRALTLDAAEIAGVAARVGSIAVGKDGDLMILNGDPLAVTTRVETVIVNGRVVYDQAGGAR